MLNQKSKDRLFGVDPRLVQVIERASELSEINFIVTEGVRTAYKQKILYEKGASKTLKSKHLIGKAVDVAAFIDRNIRWDWPLYDKIAVAVKKAARELNVEIVWGGDWKTFKDGPHFELKE